MAEAVVDGTSMSRFFCHKCSMEIERLLPDYTCPKCASGFIEELEGSSNDSDSGMGIERVIGNDNFNDIGVNVPIRDSMQSLEQHSPEHELVEVLLALSHPGHPSNTLDSRYNGLRGRRRGVWPHAMREFRRRRGRPELVYTSLENVMQDFISSFSGLELPVSQDGQPPVLFLGNPGDYVWGRDGLDTIVTQLLNQMDGTGPPPLPRKQIDEIPTTTVTQSQVDSKLQCSVCWEDFKLAEPVRQLPCQHLYHAPCIVPWLELHGTCPICRQSLGDQNSAEPNQDTVGPSLAALFRAVNESNARTASTSSSTGSSSSSSSSNSTSEI